MAVKCTVLKTLFAEIRRSSARDSRTWIVLLSDMFIDTCPGPSMIFRPASPNLEPFPLAHVALGAQNAAVLNHLSVVGSLIEIDCPPTAFARSDPLTPRPMSCATTLPPPPIDEASSMDFENTYCALSPSPFAIRLRARTVAACKMEFPSEDS